MGKTPERRISSYQIDDDPTLNFFYRPHTLTALLVMLLSFLYVALFVQDQDVATTTKL